jgi:hypothetical protein
MMESLVTADLSVRDPDAVAKLVVDRLGLPMWEDKWVHDWPETRYKAYFLRVQRDRTIAPTALEVIGPHPVGGWQPGQEGVHELQGDRPMKTHATVFSVPEVEPYRDRLAALGAPFKYDPGSATTPFAKLFVGIGSNPFSYDPSFDSGMFVELVPTSSMRLRPEIEHPPTTPGVAEGAPVRVASRAYLVDDIDDTLRVIERTFGWEPAGPVRRSEADGSLVATYAGRLPSSATFEVLQPVADGGPVADHHATYGSGAYRITFAVNGLEAAGRALGERGVDFTLEEGTGADPDRVRIDPSSVGGLVFDFVEFAAP